jgi:glycerate 2-kinase
MPRAVIAPDKFRGTATAAEVAAAAAASATACGWEPVAVPLADGGEGLLDACAVRCPETVVTEVTGPDGSTVAARWRLGDGLAVVELAEASGLTLAGGPTGNDPVRATSRGTGQLIVAAARRLGPGGTVLVGLGGSATTDGGVGLWEAVVEAGGLADVALVAACDVDTRYVDAAAVFGPQKGAGPEDVALLTDRLARQAAAWADDLGVDVAEVPGSGAAGGAGGAVVALGGTLRSGYRVVADLVGLGDALEHADRVVTGEGGLDEASFAGKVVGGVVGDARSRGLPTLVVVGTATPGAVARAEAAGCTVVSLTDRFGSSAARQDTPVRVAEVVAGWLGPAPH